VPDEIQHTDYEVTISSIFRYLDAVRRRTALRPMGSYFRIRQGLNADLMEFTPLTWANRPPFRVVSYYLGLPACRAAGRCGAMAGMGCRRGPDHNAGGASMVRAMAYAAAS
jgi:hypothetical protein